MYYKLAHINDKLFFIMAQEAARRAKLAHIQEFNGFIARITTLDGQEDIPRICKNMEKTTAGSQEAQKKEHTDECLNGQLGDLVQRIAHLTVYDASHEEFRRNMSVNYPWSTHKMIFGGLSMCSDKNLRDFVWDRYNAPIQRGRILIC